MKIVKTEIVPANRTQDKRLPKILELRNVGYSMQKIGDIYGVTRERIRQIIAAKDEEALLYTHKCLECMFTEKTFSKLKRTCIKCLLKINKKTPFEKEDLYIGEQKWRKEGRELVRHKVRFRDKFTCQVCKKIRTPEEVREHNKKCKTNKGKIKLFDVHHLNGMCGKKTKSYDKEKDMDLLVTLCHKCHFNHPEHVYNRKRYKHL